MVLTIIVNLVLIIIVLKSLSYLIRPSVSLYEIVNINNEERNIIIVDRSTHISFQGKLENKFKIKIEPETRSR